MQCRPASFYRSRHAAAPPEIYFPRCCEARSHLWLGRRRPHAPSQPHLTKTPTLAGGETSREAGHLPLVLAGGDQNATGQAQISIIRLAAFSFSASSAPALAAVPALTPISPENAHVRPHSSASGRPRVRSLALHILGYPDRRLSVCALQQLAMPSCESGTPQDALHFFRTARHAESSIPPSPARVQDQPTSSFSCLIF
jgi:hypothetical protein